MIEILTGFVIGLFTSFVFWYSLSHWVVPNLEFDPAIYREDTVSDTLKHVYRIRYRNCGRRDLIDLEFIVRLRLRGLRKEKPSLWRSIYIPVDDSRIPKIASQKGTKKKNSIRILVSQIDNTYIDILPNPLRTKFTTGDILLEDLMELGERAELEVYAFAYDRFSGAKKLFETIFYRHSIFDERNYITKLKQRKNIV